MLQKRHSISYLHSIAIFFSFIWVVAIVPEFVSHVPNLENFHWLAWKPIKNADARSSA